MQRSDAKKAENQQGKQLDDLHVSFHRQAPSEWALFAGQSEADGKEWVSYATWGISVLPNANLNGGILGQQGEKLPQKIAPAAGIRSVNRYSMAPVMLLDNPFQGGLEMDR